MLLGIIFAICTSFWLFPVLSRTSFFKSLTKLEQLILTSSLSVSSLIIIFSIASLNPWINFSFFAKIIGFITLVMTLHSIVLKFKDLNIRKIFTIVKTNPVYWLLIAIVIKIFILYSLQPIADSDLVNSYIPYANTIVESGYAPPTDMYTGNPMTIPPIGSPALIGYYLSQYKSTSEVIRYYTFIPFLGFILLTYLFGKSIFSDKRNAILSLLFVASLPLIDGALSTWKLYPDVIAAFLGLTSLYFLVFRSSEKKYLHNNSIIAGLCFAAMVLLKSQSLTFIYFTLVIATLKYISLNNTFFKCILWIAMLLPIIASAVPIGGVTSFGYGKPSYLTIIFSIIYVSVIYKNYLSNDHQHKFTLQTWIKNILILSVFMIPGFVWFARNIILYGQYVTPSNLEFLKIAEIKKIVGLYLDDQKSSFSELFIIILPAFGSLAIIPKIFGLISVIGEKVKKHLYILFLVLYSISSSIFFGGNDPRYFIGIVPFLGLLTVEGTEYIFNIIALNKSTLNNYKLRKLFIIIFALASLSQSVYLSWGSASLFYPQDTLREVVRSPQISLTSSSSQDHILSSQNKLISLGRLHTINADLFKSEDLVPLLFIELILGIFLLVLTCSAFYMIKMNSKKFLYLLSVLLLLVPYLSLILIYGKGKISDYSHNYETKRLDYWGLNSYITPYLKKNAYSDELVLIIGPNIPLSYLTHLKTRNMVVSYGIKEILPVLDFNKEETILAWLTDRHIDYVLVYKDISYRDKIATAANNSLFFSMIFNSKYYDLIIMSSTDNSWELYKLKEL